MRIKLKTILMTLTVLGLSTLIVALLAWQQVTSQSKTKNTFDPFSQIISKTTNIQSNLQQTTQDETLQAEIAKGHAADVKFNTFDPFGAKK